MTMEFPDADILNITTQPWQLYFDGSYTQHGSGAGILFVTPLGHTIPRSYRLTFRCTNNVAEYEALILGIKVAIEWKITELQVYGDSQLIIYQVNNDYQTKDDTLILCKRLVDDLRKYFIEIKFEQIPRSENKAADAMATIASLLQMPEMQDRYRFIVEQVSNPAYTNPKSQTISLLDSAQSSIYGDIYAYLKDNILPPDLSRNQKRNFICQSAKHTIIADTLYRRGLDGTLLHCLEHDESASALHEVHEGICGTHSSGLSLAKRFLHLGYYWPHMEQESYQFVKRCSKCQIHGNLIHAPAQELHPFATTWPFCKWGLDLVGKIHPSSSNGHKFIITTTEYFTKWVEAVPLTTITGKQISSFILNYLICRYGIPQSIMTPVCQVFIKTTLLTVH